MIPLASFETLHRGELVEYRLEVEIEFDAGPLKNKGVSARVFHEERVTGQASAALVDICVGFLV